MVCCCITDEKPDYFENLDLNNIITHVKVEELTKLLRQSNYDEEKIKFLEDGFTNGFDIGYSGPETRQSQSSNIPLKIGNKTILWKQIDERSKKINELLVPLQVYHLTVIFSHQ